jgi:hypothetical protein
MISFIFGAVCGLLVVVVVGGWMALYILEPTHFKQETEASHPRPRQKRPASGRGRAGSVIVFGPTEHLDGGLVLRESSWIRTRI